MCKTLILTVVVLFSTVLLYGQATPGYTQANSSPVTGNSFTSGTLPDGVSVSVEVTAVNASGESPASNIETGSVPGSGVHSFTITWESAPGATSYNIYFSTTGTTPPPPSTGVPPAPVATSLTIN